MRQMRWTVSVQRDGEVNGEPLATFTRPVDGATVADFGPSLEEGRHLLKVLQETIVQSQICAYDNARRRCRHCGAYRRIKDWRERLVATTLGEVRVRVPRVVSCLCTPEPLDDDDLPMTSQRLSECPIRRLIPGRRTPELSYLCCRFPFKLSLLDFHSVTDSSARSLTHGRSAATTRSQRPSGGAGPSCVFGPFNWHNLAFDPFKLSPPAGQRAMRESLCRVAVSQRSGGYAT